MNKMIELRKEIKDKINELNEMYDFYLKKLDESPYNTSYFTRLNEIRIEMRTYENVIEMMGSDNK